MRTCILVPDAASSLTGSIASTSTEGIMILDLETGVIERQDGGSVEGTPFSGVQMDIYQRGGLLKA